MTGERKLSLSARPKILVPFDWDQDYGFYLKWEYESAVRRAGAQIIPQVYDDSLQENLEKADGILIPGGLLDLNPKLYGDKTVHPKTKINEKRAQFEYPLIESILKMDKPVLAICWGFQIINVYLGGSLYQHLPDEFDSRIEHEQSGDRNQPTHWVEFEKAGIGKDLVGASRLFVNSTHHQGIRSLADTLSVEARSEDGLIEAFRMKEKKFFWGVEWHPERLPDDPFIPALVKACQRSN